MYTLEKLVKEAFINIYFKDEGYIYKLHKHIFDTIRCATDAIMFENYKIDKENINFKK